MEFVPQQLQLALVAFPTIGVHRCLQPPSNVEEVHVAVRDHVALVKGIAADRGYPCELGSD